MSVIQMTRLGRYGRFGNRLFQSAFMHCYARMQAIERIEAPLFEFQDHFPIQFQPVSGKLPDVYERYAVHGNEQTEQIPPAGQEFVNSDINGYFQFHTSWYRQHRDLVQSLWTPKLANLMAAAMNATDPACK